MKTFREYIAENVTFRELKAVEIFADRLLAKFDVDVEFTKHFADRMNDERNHPEIAIGELVKLFQKIAQNQAEKIKKYPGSEVVLKDIQSDLNMPVVLKYDRKRGEIDVVSKTIMRKKNFKTSNTVLRY